MGGVGTYVLIKKRSRKELFRIILTSSIISSFIIILFLRGIEWMIRFHIYDFHAIGGILAVFSVPTFLGFISFFVFIVNLVPAIYFFLEKDD